jgi:UDP-glucose 4-epimerase
VRVLITGGTGFVGGHALRSLSSAHELIATARGPVPAELEPLAEWIAVDLSRPLDPGALPAELDAIVHLAQSSRYAELPEGTEDVVAVNLGSTEALLAHARESGVGRFVFASTGGVYARSAEPIREDAPVAPLDAYFASKSDAELAVGEAGAWLAAIVLRPFFVYGPGQERMLMAGLVDKVLEGEEVAVEGDPGLRTNPIYVGDAVAAVAAALRSEAVGAFNLAGDETVSISELIGMIGEIAGREPIVRHLPPGAEGDLIGDNERMRSELSAAPRTGLRDGLREMIGDRRAQEIH